MNPLEAVRAELAAELERRAETDKRIEALRQSETLLQPIYGSGKVSSSRLNLRQAVKDVGLTRAIERVLMSCEGKPLPPTSVRNGLLEAGFELTGDNPLAAIHQVLKRIVARENSPFHAVEFQGQTMYKYSPTLTQQIMAQFDMVDQEGDPAFQEISKLKKK